MYARHEWTVVFFKLLIISWSSVTLLPTDAHRTCLCCEINVLYWDILLLSGLESAPFQPGIFTSVDLSKLSNLGTYQETGKGYDDTATERNLSKILLSLKSELKMEQNLQT